MSIIDDDIDKEGNTISSHPKKFKRMWPLCVCPCQKVTKHGSKILSAPKYSVSFSTLIWSTSSLLTKVETT